MQARKHPCDAWFGWKALIRELVVVEMLFQVVPVKQEIGAGTGDFVFLIKFPTRTENLRKGSPEGTREGPLGGTLEVFIAGLG
jgi:hypothetical protein